MTVFENGRKTADGKTAILWMKAYWSWLWGTVWKYF